MQGSAVTIGKFDGFHKGHQLLLNTLRQQALDRDLSSVVFKIDSRETQILSDGEQREIMKEMKIDRFIRQLFTADFAKMEAEEFVLDILVRSLHAKVIVVGKDFQFGKNRKGNVSLLEKMSKECGFEVYALDKEEYGDGAISSTRIRQAISEGRVEDAYSMMGHPFGFSGTVEHGKKIGTNLGFPTINIMPGTEKMVPELGVYASHTIVTDENGSSTFNSITNVGNNPTVSDGKTVTVETFIYDFDQDIYGSHVDVELVKFLRQEQKFASFEDLQKQIGRDIETSKKYL